MKFILCTTISKPADGDISLNFPHQMQRKQNKISPRVLPQQLGKLQRRRVEYLKDIPEESSKVEQQLKCSFLAYAEEIETKSDLLDPTTEFDFNKVVLYMNYQDTSNEIYSIIDGIM